MHGSRLVRVGRLSICVLTIGTASAQMAVSPALKMETIARLPLAFETQGERMTARGWDYVLGLENGKATIGVVAKDQTSHAISLEFGGARRSTAVPGGELPGKVNYIRGSDSRKWRIGVPTYSRVTYPDVYPGIDAVYYGNQQQLEFDLVVKPGADPRAVRMKIDGGRISLNGSGALKIAADGVNFEIALPKIYQEFDGTRQAIGGRYVLRGMNEVAFQLDRYDRSRPLVIDPTIVYSTLLGGGLGFSYGRAIAVDSAGNILVAGQTSAGDFPTANAFQNALDSDGPDAFVTKFNAAGTSLIYSTYLGGYYADAVYGLAVDSAGSAWVTGQTSSTDFPILNAAQSTSGDAFVAKLDVSGVLQFSTFLGGLCSGQAIAVDSAGNGYVTGDASGAFPTTAGVLQSANQGGNDVFVTKYSPAGAVVYSTLAGGGKEDYGYGIAVDSVGAAYVTGYSYSSSFAGAPAGGAQTTNAGGGDVFVAKLNPNATALCVLYVSGGSWVRPGKRARGGLIG